MICQHIYAPRGPVFVFSSTPPRIDQAVVIGYTNIQAEMAARALTLSHRGNTRTHGPVQLDMAVCEIDFGWSGGSVVQRLPA